MKKKYIIYARAASQEKSKQGSGLDNQVKVLQEYAKKNNLIISEVIAEYGSGYACKLPGIGRMLKKLLDGEAQGILCTTWDRLTRDIVIHCKYKRLFEKENIEVIAVYQPIENKLMEAVMFQVANNFREMHSYMIKRALQIKKARAIAA